MGKRALRPYTEWSFHYTKILKLAIENGSHSLDLFGVEQAARSRFDYYQFIRTLKEADDVPEDLKAYATRIRVFWKKTETWIKVVVEDGPKDVFSKAAEMSYASQSLKGEQTADILSKRLEEDLADDDFWSTVSDNTEPKIDLSGF